MAMIATTIISSINVKPPSRRMSPPRFMLAAARRRGRRRPLFTPKDLLGAAARQELVVQARVGLAVPRAGGVTNQLDSLGRDLRIALQGASDRLAGLRGVLTRRSDRATRGVLLQ